MSTNKCKFILILSFRNDEVPSDFHKKMPEPNSFRHLAENNYLFFSSLPDKTFVSPCFILTWTE